MTNRIFRKAILLSAISALAIVAAPAAAQITPAQIERIVAGHNQRWKDFEASMRLAESAQYAGDCGSRNGALDTAERSLRNFMDVDQELSDKTLGLSRLFMEEQEFQNRLGLITVLRNRPCPAPVEPLGPEPIIAGDTGNSPPAPDDGLGVGLVDSYDVEQQQQRLQILEEQLDDVENAWRSGDCDAVSSEASEFEFWAMNSGGSIPPQTEAALYRRLNEIKARPCPPVLPPLVEGRIGWFTWGRDKKVVTGTGVLIEPGNERFAETSDDEARGQGVEFTVIYNASPDDGLSFEGRIGRARDRNATSIAPGTIPVGSVYHDRAPSSGSTGGGDSGGSTGGDSGGDSGGSTGGSTGINLGATGLDAILERDSEYEWFGAAYQRRIAGANGGPQVKLRAVFNFERISDDFDLSLRSPTFPTISMDARQEVRQTNLGGGVGVEVGSPLRHRTSAGETSPSNRLAEGPFWIGTVDLSLYRADSTLDSTQRNICGVCGAAERDFTIALTDQDKRWGLGAEAGLALGYRFPGGFEIGVKGAADYRSQVAGVRNPETGDDLFLRNQPTQLVFEDSLGWRVGAFIGFHF